jgi:hypothetical protein
MSKSIIVTLSECNFDKENSDSWGDFLNQLGVSEKEQSNIRYVELVVADYKIVKWGK